jgi:mono/diheme cytochrome c family protein
MRARWWQLRTRHGLRLRAYGSPLAIVAILAMAGAGCRQDMHDAPRFDPLEATTLFHTNASAQPIVAGTVPRGHLNEDTLLHTGKLDGRDSPVFPFPITRADLDRGEERFNIYCSPCHGRTGDGNGMVVQRGYRQAASYHIDRLRTIPVGYIFDVITNGFGVMPDYRTQIPVEDRWRIVAYVRALQLSRNATPADVPADEMERLRSGAPPAAPAAGGEGRGETGGQQ